MSFEQAFKEISILVNDFKANEQHFLNPSYSEADVRNDFINKFFFRQQAKTEGDKNYLERKCETLDKQIDKLVYQLYGLTEEEIKIVEGSAK